MKQGIVLKIVCVVLALSFFAGLVFMMYNYGGYSLAKSEFSETAERLQKAIYDNEVEVATGTLNYDTYKAALNSAVKSLKEGEQLVHINVGFGSLDRGLKYINDTFGHLNGKPTIKAFTDLLKDVFPEDQGWVIAHRGGSGFLVYGIGHFDEQKLLGYYNELKSRWHDTPYKVPTTGDEVKGMALLYLAVVGPECGDSFRDLRDQLVYKKLALRDKTNCGYVIMTEPGKYSSSEQFNEADYMEEDKK